MIGFSAGSLSYVIINFMIKMLKKKKGSTEKVSKIDCLLFSPQLKWSWCSIDNSFKCKQLSCPFCNYQELLNLLKSAEHKVDVCMYLITLDEITKLLIKLVKKGVFVRIVTDKQMSVEASKAKIQTFLEACVPINVIHTSDIMHNKFVLIDQKILITGSFNWTRQGTCRNYENAVVIHNDEIIEKFQQYFDELFNKETL